MAQTITAQGSLCKSIKLRSSVQFTAPTGGIPNDYFYDDDDDAELSIKESSSVNRLRRTATAKLIQSGSLSVFPARLSSRRIGTGSRGKVKNNSSRSRCVLSLDTQRPHRPERCQAASSLADRHPNPFFYTTTITPPASVADL